MSSSLSLLVLFHLPFLLHFPFSFFLLSSPLFFPLLYLCLVKGAGIAGPWDLRAKGSGKGMIVSPCRASSCSQVKFLPQRLRSREEKLLDFPAPIHYLAWSLHGLALGNENRAIGSLTLPLPQQASVFPWPRNLLGPPLPCCLPGLSLGWEIGWSPRKRRREPCRCGLPCGPVTGKGLREPLGQGSDHFPQKEFSASSHSFQILLNLEQPARSSFVN